MVEHADVDILLADIAGDCARLHSMLARFESSYETFRCDYVYQDAAILGLQRATASAAQLPGAFKSVFPQIDWEKLETIQQYVTQNQRVLDAEVLWDAILDYALPLGAFCEEHCRDSYC